MIRVLLADDHAIVRMGLRAVLDSEEDITIVGEADTADDAVRAVENAGADIDVVLMDLRFGANLPGFFMVMDIHQFAVVDTIMAFYMDVRAALHEFALVVHRFSLKC